jgi:hypothetical protein
VSNTSWWLKGEKHLVVWVSDAQYHHGITIKEFPFHAGEATAFLPWSEESRRSTPRSLDEHTTR